MRAIVCSALTGLDGLALGERPDPGAPGPGAVRIRIAAAGLNYADLLVTQGKYQVKHEPPFVPGFEAAGTIEAVGPQVTQFKVGDRVIAIPEAGAFAEIAIVSADRVYPAPTGLDAAEAAGFPIAYGTSYVALVEQAKLQPGETLLVHGAAGGVGLTAVEIGKALGARVIATAGGPDKCAIASRPRRRPCHRLQERGHPRAGEGAGWRRRRRLRPGRRRGVRGLAAGGELERAHPRHRLCRRAGAADSRPTSCW